MKFSCLQENLSRILNINNRIISSRISLPVLGNILIEAKGGRIITSSTNLEVGLICKTGGKVEEEGGITIPARLITDYINSLPNNRIDFDGDENLINIKCKNNQASIKGIPPTEFPQIPKIKNKTLVVIDPKELSRAISLVAFAAALDESRPVLSGVYWSSSGKKLKLVATDSYRLAEGIIDLKSEIKEEWKFIIPSRSMAELNRILMEVEEPVEVMVSENQVWFKIGDIELTSRLIEGTFPNYEQIIPQTYQTKATFATNDFIEALKRVSLFARETSNNVKITLSKKKGIEISTTASQIGETSSEIEAKVEGEEGEITFNVKYLLDVFSNLKNKEAILELGGRFSPGVIRPVGKEEYTHIIMPLRV